MLLHTSVVTVSNTPMSLLSIHVMFCCMTIMDLIVLPKHVIHEYINSHNILECMYKVYYLSVHNVCHVPLISSVNAVLSPGAYILMNFMSLYKCIGNSSILS